METKSKKPIKSLTEVLGKRMFLFDSSLATDFDVKTQKKGMYVSINRETVFIPCGEPIDLPYNIWALLKNIGKIPKIVSENWKGEEENV